MTVEEWAALPEDTEGELVDGLLVEEEMPDLEHELATAWLIGSLRAWVRPRGGHVTGSEIKLALGANHGRKPDVAVFMPGRKGLTRRGPVRVPPDICVEILSATARDHRRDRVTKLDEYAAFGVRSYWLLDPGARTFELFELNPAGQYVHVLGVSTGKVKRVPACPGLSLDLDSLWSEIDQLPADDEPPSSGEAPVRRPAATPKRAAPRKTKPAAARPRAAAKR